MSQVEAAGADLPDATGSQQVMAVLPDWAAMALMISAGLMLGFLFLWWRQQSRPGLAQLTEQPGGRGAFSVRPIQNRPEVTTASTAGSAAVEVGEIIVLASMYQQAHAAKSKARKREIRSVISSPELICGLTILNYQLAREIGNRTDRTAEAVLADMTDRAVARQHRNITEHQAG